MSSIGNISSMHAAILVAVMAVVTFLLRALPFLVFHKATGTPLIT